MWLRTSPRTTAARGMVNSGTPAAQQRPHLTHFFVFDPRDRLARGCNVLVENAEDFVSIGRFANRYGSPPTGAISRDGVVSVTASQFGKVRQVVGVPSDRVRLRVGLPLKLVLRNALEHLACVGHLLIELGQDRFGVSS